MTGIGSFISGTVVSPLLAQGLTVNAQAISHIAGSDDIGSAAAGVYAALPIGPAANMESWAAWVRASLYLTDVLKRLDWTPGKRRTAAGLEPFNGIELSYGRKPLIALHRPPADLFRRQLKYIRSYADQRSDRAAEILTQVGYPIDYFASILGLNADANRSTFELIGITQVVTSHVAMVAKHHLACRRPDRLGATVMPMIPTPAHGTFPSAHAAEAFAAATVLEGLLKKLDARPPAERHYPQSGRLIRLLYKQAERIAVNRTVAGVHYPIDTWAGAALGEAVGQIILAKCQGGHATPRIYEARDSDFLLADFLPGITGGSGDPATKGLVRAAAPGPVQSSPLFAWLWAKALNEFKL
ncbi:hypothetical protein AXW83_21000 [Bosea sp. PAMC 26642]|nr:hypothetical protein AXW83_21000 [Bosea sp. PAMC 26642]